MKKLLFILLLLCSASAFAQDVIVKKDGSTVVCRVEKVSDTDVTYKLWTDLKGSSYVIDKSLVSAINYESGKKETFSETTSLYKPNNQNDGVQSMNDAALLRMDWGTNNPYKKVKWLRSIGWIGGGALVAVGIGSIAMSSGLPNSGGICTGAGIAGIALGAGVTTLCLVKANKEKKKIDAVLQTSSIYRYDIPFSNGSSLSVGADMLHDRILDKRTIGLGLSYNF
ncbi:MAG: hypothetical protein IJS63_07515 [Bacteroidaceae bacterium]|nr:hypothetical protein [Bacteroidaceae bacterium]